MVDHDTVDHPVLLVNNGYQHESQPLPSCCRHLCPCVSEVASWVVPIGLPTAVGLSFLATSVMEIGVRNRRHLQIRLQLRFSAWERREKPINPLDKSKYSVELIYLHEIVWLPQVSQTPLGEKFDRQSTRVEYRVVHLVLDDLLLTLK